MLDWYDTARRDLPWRRTDDPYRIWLSEVMLQQTRVTAVLPYYQRFLERFPDVQSLAAAEDDALLGAWAGLGYYSRARNLREAARRIVERGEFPSDYTAIRDLPGVGDYTAAAVASIAFGLSYAAVDGNVVRVLSRIEASTLDRKQTQAHASRLIDPERPGDFNQALMELGATICLPRNPQCLLCPVAKHCLARREGRQEEFPAKEAREYGFEEKSLLVVSSKGRTLLWRRPDRSTRLAGFWELPESTQLPAATVGELAGQFRHSIVNVTYSFSVYPASVRRVPSSLQWVEAERLSTLPLSTTTRKALRVFRTLQLESH